MNMKVRKRITT